MFRIYKKELGSYYKGIFGWLFNAVFLLFVGLYTIIVNFNMAYPNFEYTLNNISFIYIIIIPVLTMRSFAEEKKQKTDRLLYSLPVKMNQVLLGKYLALVSVLAVPVLIMLAYPLFLKSLGAASAGAAYASIFGFLLLGAALTAIGVFSSTLTENMAVSAAGSFAIFLLIYFSASLAAYLPSSAKASFYAICVSLGIAACIIWLLTKSLPLTVIVSAAALGAAGICYVRKPGLFVGLVPDIIAELSLFGRYYEYANAILDLRTVVYYLTVIGVFLYLSDQSLERKRWS